jgi:hypothetical protein
MRIAEALRSVAPGRRFPVPRSLFPAVWLALALGGCASPGRAAMPRLDASCNLVLPGSRSATSHDATLEYQSYAPVDSVFDHSVSVLVQRGFQACSVDRGSRTAVFQPEMIEVEGARTHLLLRLSVARNTYGATGRLDSSWGIRAAVPDGAGYDSLDDPALRYVVALRDELSRGLR